MLGIYLGLVIALPMLLIQGKRNGLSLFTSFGVWVLVALPIAALTKFLIG